MLHPLRFFHNGQEAREYLNTIPDQPFFILCDINMPLMNRIELRRRINANDYIKKAIHFIYLTTADNPGIIRAAYGTMGQGYYKKATTITGLENYTRSW